VCIGNNDTVALTLKPAIAIISQEEMEKAKDTKPEMAV